MPYDRFITEQIAGDLLPHEDDAQRDRQLVATGFLAIGAKPAKAMNNNFAMDVVDLSAMDPAALADALLADCIDAEECADDF